MPSRSLRGQSITCDPILVALAQGENGYQNRGKHCEGVHAKQVAGGAVLNLLSLSEKRPASQRDTIHLVWFPPRADSIAIAAQSTKRGRFYGMTTRARASSGSFAWPFAFAAADGFAPDDFAFRAWIIPVAGADTVFIPVSTQLDTAGALVAYVVPDSPLAQLIYSVGEIGNDGLVSRWIKQDLRVHGDYFPRNVPIRLQLYDRMQSRLLKITVRAIPEVGSDPVSLGFVVQTAGRP